MEESLKEVDEDDVLEVVFRQGGEGGGIVMEIESIDIVKIEIVSEDEVYWYYKWENIKNVIVYGLYFLIYMLIWNEQGCFGDGVWVRKVGEDEGGLFYNLKRIDFEFYI